MREGQKSATPCKAERVPKIALIMYKGKEMFGHGTNIFQNDRSEYIR